METAIVNTRRRTRAAALVIALAAVLSVVFAGVAYAATINGNDRDNNLTGTDLHDWIRGFGGEDTLRGLAGTDNLSGGAGDDTIYGGDGEDFLRGAGGNDVLYAGDDKKSDEVRCGAGTDVAYVSGSDHSHNNITGCEDIRNQ